MPRLPTVAIVGRPNVGKSTLFNRLVGKRLALVDDQPGVTRDRREGQATLLGLDFTIVDTAGFEDEDAATLPGRMRMQTQAAVEMADVALFMIDGREGLTYVWTPAQLRDVLGDDDGRWAASIFDVTEAGTKKRLAIYVVTDPQEVPGIARLGPDPGGIRKDPSQHRGGAGVLRGRQPRRSTTAAGRRRRCD